MLQIEDARLLRDDDAEALRAKAEEEEEHERRKARNAVRDALKRQREGPSGNITPCLLFFLPPLATPPQSRSLLLESLSMSLSSVPRSSFCKESPSG